MRGYKFSEEDWASDVYSEMVKRAELLKNVISTYTEFVEKAPKGYLRVMKHRDTYQYFHRLDSKDLKGIYIPKGKSKLIHSLAQRDYYRAVINEAEKELSELERFFTKIKPNHIEDIYFKLNPGRKGIVIPMVEPEDQLRDRWEKEEYIGKEVVTASDFITHKGEKVRSKSEVIIANMLKEYNIPYQYEYPITISGVTLHPDFKTINLRTRKEMIWEHFGMMDDIGYARENMEKLDRYESSGFFPGDKLIITFETSKLPINTRIIKRNIEEYLL